MQQTAEKKKQKLEDISQQFFQITVKLDFSNFFPREKKEKKIFSTLVEIKKIKSVEIKNNNHRYWGNFNYQNASSSEMGKQYKSTKKHKTEHW